MKASSTTFLERHITLGVGGGIAAYKAAQLVSQLRQRGARVQVILTRAGARFVTPLTFEALSHTPVLQNLFAEAPLDHVRLAHESDLFVVAPATYDLIGKLDCGLADDYLTTTLAATVKPVLLCPAMEEQMFASPLLQKNLRTLTALNYRVLEPATGPLASGRTGRGRLPEVHRILEAMASLLVGDQLLSGKRFLVSAGPTRERIDPMRVLSNRSSGKMGYALADAAARLGAEVTLVSGPTHLSVPGGVKVVRVESAAEMFASVTQLAPHVDVVLMAAAVADWTPKHPDKHKRSKHEKTSLSLELTRTQDILSYLGRHRHGGQILVGFAAETEAIVEKARRKLEAKNVDFIVANDVSQAAESDLNAVTLLARNGDEQVFPSQPKRTLAAQLLQAIV